MDCEVLLQLVSQRLGDHVLPDVRDDLLRLATYDASRIAQNPWIWVLPAVQSLIEAEAVADITPFFAAWGFMYAATIRLDQLQDHDPVDDPLPTDQLDAQYNLLLTYYVLASSLLDHLIAEAFPPNRLLQLRRFWSDMLLRMASGQQHDLTRQHAPPVAVSLDDYEQIARAKTGAAFALAFGGTAILLSDDSALIALLTSVGEIFGMLVQYGDDLADAADQPNPTVTFPGAFHQFAHAHKADGLAHTSAAFSIYIYHVYRDHVRQLSASYPDKLRQGLLTIFARAFEAQYRK